MTREELKRQVSEAGKYFIDEMCSGQYLRSWIDSHTIEIDLNMERLNHMIYFYNKEITKWIESGLQNDGYRSLAYGYYCSLEGMLYILRDVHYYKPLKHGDINPFIDYCWACWFERHTIDFAEYEQIRSFFEEA